MSINTYIQYHDNPTEGHIVVYNKKKISKLVCYFTFLYAIILIVPAFLYIRSPFLFNYFFYGRFIFLVLVTGGIILLKNPRIAQWDTISSLCWFILCVVYTMRNINGEIRGILFSVSIFWHIYIFKKIFNSKELINYARESVIWASITLIIISLIVTIIFPSFRIYTETIKYTIMRSGGILYNAQQLGPYIIISFIFIIYNLISGRRKIFFPLLFIVVAMAILTGSRMVLTSIVLSNLLIIFLFNKKAINYTLILSFILIMSVAFQLIEYGFLKEDLFKPIYVFFDKYFLRGEPENLYTFGYRIYLWEFGFSKFLESPIWGHGTYRIGEYVPLGRIGSIQGEFMAHNGFIKVLTETGLLGFVPLTVILAFTIIKSIKKIKNGFSELKLPFLFLVTGIYSNLWESWILSFGYVPCWVLWLSITEILMKENKKTKNVKKK